MTEIQNAQDLKHQCSRVAYVNDDPFRYVCVSHADGYHNYAAGPDPCGAPWCKLPPGHRGVHDIPAGKPRFVTEASAYSERLLPQYQGINEKRRHDLA